MVLWCDVIGESWQQYHITVLLVYDFMISSHKKNYKNKQGKDWESERRTACCEKTASKMLLERQFTITAVFEPREEEAVVMWRVLENDVHFSVIRRACCPTHNCNQFSDGNVSLTEGPVHMPCCVSRLVTIWHISKCPSLIQSVMLDRDVAVLPGN